jgi:hypothetical protein
MRYLLFLTLLVGCGKSDAQKQKEADQCQLDYGADHVSTCLTSKYDWKTMDASLEQYHRLHPDTLTR